jgi:transcription elongation factor Elf1
MSDIQSQVSSLKQELNELIKQIRCPQCNKLLAVHKGKQVVIRCGRCGHDHAIDYSH